MPTSHVRLLVGAALATLALAACGSSSKSSADSATTTVAPTTTVAAGTTTVPAASATVSSAQNTKIGKAILVDGKGMTLYVWDNDKTANASDCAKTPACIAAWPPVVATGTPTYGTGLTASMFSTFMTSNGMKWVTVNGKPLYTWINDKKAGDATGQGINGFYVVGTDGQKIDSD
jgi:predicted lipoprotein with Yx(FWY)xxD motif